MTKEYIEREAAKSELLSWAVSINHPEYLIKDDALHVIDSIPAADVECCGRLRGVTYEDGKITAVYIRDTDDVVKVFVPVRHGRWICIRKGYGEYECSVCHGVDSDCSDYYGTHVVTEQDYCPNCGSRMDGGDE